MMMENVFDLYEELMKVHSQYSSQNKNIIHHHRFIIKLDPNIISAVSAISARTSKSTNVLSTKKLYLYEEDSYQVDLKDPFQEL